MEHDVLHTTCGTLVNFTYGQQFNSSTQRSGHYANEELANQCSARIPVYSLSVSALRGEPELEVEVQGVLFQGPGLIFFARAMTPPTH